MNKFFYPLVKNPFSKNDIKKAKEVLDTKQLTMSKTTNRFEESFTKKIKPNFSLMVNSGSSANLLALQCLINPYRRDKLKPGDEVILPTFCWSTSLWPIVQANLKPIFVDINPNSLNIDENQI